MIQEGVEGPYEDIDKGPPKQHNLNYVITNYNYMHMVPNSDRPNSLDK